MKFVALVSGGKDSLCAILECVKLGHELVACVHLGRPTAKKPAEGGNEEAEEESYMYQTAGSEAVRTLVEECLEVPLVLQVRRGRSVDTSLSYGCGPTPTTETDASRERDEVEDLIDALVEAQRLCDFQGVSSGAILSTYQRVRVEHVCSLLGLQSLAFLWRRDAQHRLLDRMIAEDGDGIDAVLVKVAAPPGLLPHKHLGKSLRELQPHFLKLHEHYQFHVCGEGGEYETLVVDCPLYRRNRLVLDRVEIVSEADDGVGEMRVLACHADPKDCGDVVGCDNSTTISRASKSSDAAAPSHGNDNDRESESASPSAVPAPPPSRDRTPTTASPALPALEYSPRVRRVAAGLLHVEALSAGIGAPDSPRRAAVPGATEKDGTADDAVGELAEEEAQRVFRTLRVALERHGCTPLDVAFVHLYLGRMSDFVKVNRVYRDFFGVSLPPSRSCVGLRGLMRQGKRLQLDCLAQCGSGDALRGIVRSNAELRSVPRREVLHVQSLSHWAPVCVGPYSQANTLYGLHWVAGQIGLDPPTMVLRSGWEAQLRQAWRNLARVLDALGGADLSHVVMGLVYATSDVWGLPGSLDRLCHVCREQRSSNGGVVAGAVDGTTRPNDDDDHDGYEDDETRQALSGCGTKASKSGPEVPLLVVAVSELPVGAKVEVEAVASTRESHASLQRTQVVVRDTVAPDSKELDGWSTGHDFKCHPQPRPPPMYHIEAWCLSLESGAVSNGLVMAFVEEVSDPIVECDVVFRAMMRSLARCCAESAAHVPPALHVRLFYRDVVGHDDTPVRAAFHASLALLGSDDCVPPATSLVPVDSISFVHEDSPFEGRFYVFAIQALMVDPVRAEADLWIHQGRG